MQTPKARAGTLKVSQRKSPATPRTARQLKTPNSDSDSVSSPNAAKKSPKDRSPKVIKRRSTQSPISENKQPSKVQELESQIARLQEYLKSVKDQLNSSESWKRKIQQEDEESKKQLVALSKELEESHQRLLDLMASEDARFQELRNISQNRDRAWQSELEAVQKQHTMNSVALAAAMNEIQKLKIQLERTGESELSQINRAESAHTEIQELKMDLDKTLSMLEKLKNEVSDCKESESSTLEVDGKMQMQLETANQTVETLQSDGMKAAEAYKSLVVELEQSRTQATSLEELVCKLQVDLLNSANKNISSPTNENGPSQENEEINQLKAELISTKAEVGQLKSALDMAEARYQEEHIQSTLQIRSAFEQLECTKSESSRREVELYEELRRAKGHIEELRTSMMDKESQLLTVAEENKELNFKIKKNQSTKMESEPVIELKKLDAYIAELKGKLLDRETELQKIVAENNTVKMEIKEELGKNKITNEAIASAEAARGAMQEALTKLGHTKEEADKSNKRVAWVTEQLDAVQAANSELEAELRRLKVQSDQWRKAAEAAASMISAGNNGKFVDRNDSRKSSFNSITAKMNSPYLEDTDDESPKKKNTNMFKRIGILWRKNHS